MVCLVLCGSGDESWLKLGTWLSAPWISKVCAFLNTFISPLPPVAPDRSCLEFVVTRILEFCLSGAESPKSCSRITITVKSFPSSLCNTFYLTFFKNTFLYKTLFICISMYIMSPKWFVCFVFFSALVLPFKKKKFMHSLMKTMRWWNGEVMVAVFTLAVG